MKVAELTIICGRHSFAGGAPSGKIGFSSLDQAKAEFDRIADLMKRREDRANELDKQVIVKGIGEFVCTLDDITVVGLNDLELENEEERGIREAFPNLFVR